MIDRGRFLPFSVSLVAASAIARKYSGMKLTTLAGAGASTRELGFAQWVVNGSFFVKALAWQRREERMTKIWPCAQSMKVSVTTMLWLMLLVAMPRIVWPQANSATPYGG